MAKITHEDLSAQFGLQNTDPEKYLELANRLVQQDPSDGAAYFSRHQVWSRLGRYDHALADLDKSLNIEPDHVTYRARGNLLRKLGRYREAIEDFNRSEALAPEEWLIQFGPLFRAECHARLGNEDAALADCANLPEDHWTPGLLGAPAGSREEVAFKLRCIAAEARQRQKAQ